MAVVLYEGVLVVQRKGISKIALHMMGVLRSHMINISTIF